MKRCVRTSTKYQLYISCFVRYAWRDELAWTRLLNIYIFFVGSRLFEFRAIPNEYFPRFYSNSCCFNFCPLLLCQRQNINNWCIQLVCITFRGRRGRVRMVVGFATTYAISTYHH